MSRRRRWIMAIVGLLSIAFGIATSIASVGMNADFAADPMCTRSITLTTSPRVGKTCSIVAGTVSHTYEDGIQSSTTHRQLDHHIVVFTSDGRVLDVVLENEFWSPMYGRAVHGAPIVVETFQGKPAFVATSAGTLSASYDPRLPLAICWLFIPFGAVFLIFAIRGQRATSSAGMSKPRSR